MANARDGNLFGKVAGMRAYSFTKKELTPSQMLSCEICEVYRTSFLLLQRTAELNAFDFHQHFERIICFVSNKSM